MKPSQPSHPCEAPVSSSHPILRNMRTQLSKISRKRLILCVNSTLLKQTGGRDASLCDYRDNKNWLALGQFCRDYGDRRHIFCLWIAGLWPRQSKGWHRNPRVCSSRGGCSTITIIGNFFLPLFSFFLSMKSSFSILRGVIFPSWLFTPSPPEAQRDAHALSHEAFCGRLYSPEPHDTHSISVPSNRTQPAPGCGV